MWTVLVADQSSQVSGSCLQGVRGSCEGNFDRAWRLDEERVSKMVAIGRDLPKDIIRQGFQECSVDFKDLELVNRFTTSMNDSDLM